MQADNCDAAWPAESLCYLAPDPTGFLAAAVAATPAFLFLSAFGFFASLLLRF